MLKLMLKQIQMNKYYNKIYRWFSGRLDDKSIKRGEYNSFLLQHLPKRLADNFIKGKNFSDFLEIGMLCIKKLFSFFVCLLWVVLTFFVEVLLGWTWKNILAGRHLTDPIRKLPADPCYFIKEEYCWFQKSISKLKIW